MNKFILSSILLLLPTLAMSQAINDPNYSLESLHSGDGITTIKFLPNGDILATEKQGFLLYLSRNSNASYATATEILDLTGEIAFNVESGLLGLAVDPFVSENRFIYLLFTTLTDQKIVRYTLNESLNSVVTSTRHILLEGLPKVAPHHNSGDLGFHPSDPNHLFATIGDDDDPDASQNLDLYNGKILRINKSNGAGLSDNPFYDNDLNSIRSKIWALGFRNAYRFTFVPQLPDVLFASENGGPDGQRLREDRVTRVSKGGNCGWSQFAAGAGANSDWFNTPDEGCQFLAALPPSVVGIAIATGGAYGNLNDPTKSILYWGTWFGGLHRYQFTDENLTNVEPYPDASSNVFTDDGPSMHLEWGLDQSLYGSETGGDAAIGGWYQIQRYNYIGPPIGTEQIKTVKAQNGSGRYILKVQLGSEIVNSMDKHYLNVNGRTISHPKEGIYLERRR